MGCSPTGTQILPGDSLFGGEQEGRREHKEGFLVLTPLSPEATYVISAYITLVIYPRLNARGWRYSLICAQAEENMDW